MVNNRGWRERLIELQVSREAWTYSPTVARPPGDAQGGRETDLRD